MLADSSHLVICILLAGIGVIFLYTDWRTPASRTLAGAMFAMGGAMLFASANEVSKQTIAMAAFMQISEVIAILCGLEWGRLLSQSSGARSRIGRAAHGLFRGSQALILVYGVVSVGYILILPEFAVIDPSGVVKVRPVEFAVFAPLLACAVALAGLAILLLMLTPVDPAERIRLRALFVAGPLFLLTMLINDHYEPLIMALGIVVFLGGSVHYLVVQSQRGTAMRQFISPELAHLVNQDGMDTAMRRERRELSVVACDLRGFTRYARRTDSDTVISLLERYYAQVGIIATQFDGTVKDHAGDGVLILVGAPKPCADHAGQAVRMALAIVAQSESILALAFDSTEDPADGQARVQLGLGVGIATGEATIGAIRGAGRLEYVAVGNVVNLAARLCDRAADREILLDANTRHAAALESITQEGHAESLKGFTEPVAVFSLSGGPSLSAPTQAAA